MIVCPNCNHQNPDGASQCEACLTPLPSTMNCPACGATVQTDAAFCGQCGYNLQGNSSEQEEAQAAPIPPTAVSSSPIPSTAAVPDIEEAEPLVQADPLVGVSAASGAGESSGSIPDPDEAEEPLSSQPVSAPPPMPTPVPTPAPPTPQPVAPTSKTQLQQQTARLLHVQTNTPLELPQNVSVIHLGKPNDLIPPDVDVSGFPHSEVVSRVHADIRVEADAYYIEDVGSSNGTYVNNMPLSRGNRHRLRPGDRIALGKGDMVTFLFQLS